MNECTECRNKLAKQFKDNKTVFMALGDETRQQILMVLLQNETVGMRVPEITKSTHLSRPAVSHHLKILMDAGLIRMHRRGTMNFYYANADEQCWGELKELINQVYNIVRMAAESGYPYLEEDD